MDDAPKANATGNAEQRPDEEAELLETIGQRVRKLRTGRKMSRRALAEASGLSQRYLVQLENGSGNISLRLLHRVAEALGREVEWLVRKTAPPKSDLARIGSLLGGANAKQRSEILKILDPDYQPVHKAHRIAFVGLRGAGKSTLGRLLCELNGLPFLELNQEIERISGIPVHEVMALYGNEGYRRLEMQSLRRIIDSDEDLVLAVAGGIVTQPETYKVLLENCFTIWLRALPEEHMARVRGQGDERPMAGNPDAMQQLKEILSHREPYYAQANVEIDTSERTVEESFKDVLEAVNTSGQ